MSGLTQTVLQNLHGRILTHRSESVCSVKYNNVTVSAQKGMITISPDMALSGMFSAYEFSVWFLPDSEMGQVTPNRKIVVDGVDYGIIRAFEDPYSARWQVDLRAIDG